MSRLRKAVMDGRGRRRICRARIAVIDVGHIAAEQVPEEETAGQIVLKIQAHNPEQEEAEEELEVSYQGADFAMGFNVGYLLDAPGMNRTIKGAACRQPLCVLALGLVERTAPEELPAWRPCWMSARFPTSPPSSPTRSPSPPETPVGQPSTPSSSTTLRSRESGSGPDSI